jgi:hypothetical protein
MIKNKTDIFLVFLIASFLMPLSVYAMELDNFHTPLAKKDKLVEEDDINRASQSFLLAEQEGFIGSAHLIKSGSKYHSEKLNKDVDLYTCDKKEFDTIFPIVQYNEEYEWPSDCVGQIQVTGGDTSASGTLISMDYNKNNNNITFKCVTALHVFASFDKKNGLSIRHGREFVLGRKETHSKSGKVYNLGVSSINKVLVQNEPKDLCIFEGNFNPSSSLYKSPEAFYNEFKDNIPEIVETQEKGVLLASMYHYPFGIKSQRANSGKVDLDIKKHYMDSIYGSSGAAIFNKDSKIFAVHTAHDAFDKSKIAIVKGIGADEEAPIVDANLFELFSMKEYNDLVGGINLYDNSQLTYELKSKIGTAVENRLLR